MGVQVSPVQKVIQLLDDLAAKVRSDVANEGKLMEEYTAWCDEESNEKEDAITSSKRSIADLQATIQDADATIGSLTASIDETTNKISTSEAELASATDIRHKARGDFAAAEKELVETVDSLSRATLVLKKNLGLLQSGKAVRELGAMASGLQKVVEASWVNAHQKQVLQSLIQSQASEEDEDLSMQPQASVQAYGSQSSGILDTIADMQDKAEESLSGSRRDEMEAQHAYEMVKTGLEDEIAVRKKQLSQATQARSASEEELNHAKATLAETIQTLGADSQYLEELKQNCAAKESAWAERQQQADEETAAIKLAKDTLSSGVKVLLQTTMHVASKVKEERSAGVRDQVAGILKRLAKEFHSYTFMEMSSRAQSDPFGKVRGLIESMVDKLQKQAAEEADGKAFCDEENSKSRKKQADLSGKLDKTTARIQKAEAGKAKLAEDIQTLQAEVAEIDAGQAEATKLRQSEHDEYLKASADFRDSAAAVAKAVEVLNNYYNSASLLQLRTQTRRMGAKQPEFGGAKGDVGSTITSMLEVAESDFTRMLADAEADESAGKAAFDKLTQANAVTKETKQEAAKAKGSEAKQLEVALGNYKDDHATTSSELDAVLAYLDKLKPQCETKAMSYGEKKARREKEISGLKEAMAILSGEALLQTKTVLRGARRV